ncbi:MAG: hypothetical protein MK180_14200 [Rhodobacteraceae bacterium]|nr:hypothetical protein [Paracoccaceae bacterium]
MIRRMVADLEGLRKKPAFKAARFTGSPIVLANVAEMMPLLGRVADAFRAAAPNARLRLLEMGSRANLLESFDKLLPVCTLTVRSPSYPLELMTKPLWFSD